MAGGSSIRNTGQDSASLPFPLAGVLSPGQLVCVTAAPDIVQAALGSPDVGKMTLVVASLPASYAGPYQLAYQGVMKDDGTVSLPAGDISPLTANLDAGTHKVTNLGAPTAGSADASTALYAETKAAAAQAAAEAYTDTQLSNAIKGLSQKPNARFAPTAALPAYVISGGGSTMTMVALLALPAQDGVTAQLHDVFFYDQDTQHAGVDNGLWQITVLGAGGTATVAQRISQLAVGAGAMGALTAIVEGTTRQGQEWLCYNDEGADVVGTNALVFKNVSIFGNLSTTTPAVNGVGAVGAGTTVARADHAHPDSAWTVPGAYPYTTLATDRKVLVDCSAARTIHIDYTALADGQEIEIVAKGTGASGAATNNVTIDTVNGGTIVGPPGAALIATDQDKRRFAKDLTNTVIREV